MTWAEIITTARRLIEEPTETNITDDAMKQYGLDRQREMADVCYKAFPVKRSFLTVAGTGEEYTLAASIGSDVLGLTRVVYNGDYDLVPISFDCVPQPNSTPGTPTYFWVRSGYIGFYPYISTGSISINAWGYRIPPKQAMTIVHDAGASASAATVAKSGTTLSLVITGGTNAGTNTFDVSTATLDTLGELVISINGLGKGFTATKHTGLVDAESSLLLEDRSATSCFSTTLNLYEDPEAPVYAQKALVFGMVASSFLELQEFDKAMKYEQMWMSGLQQVQKLADRRTGSFQFGNLPDMYGGAVPGNVFPAPGGYFVRIP